MNWRKVKPLEVIHCDQEPWFGMDDWLNAARELLADGARPVAHFSREMNGGQRVSDCVCRTFRRTTLHDQHRVFTQGPAGLSRAFPRLSVHELFRERAL